LSRRAGAVNQRNEFRVRDPSTPRVGRDSLSPIRKLPRDPFRSTPATNVVGLERDYAMRPEAKTATPSPTPVASRERAPDRLIFTRRQVAQLLGGIDTSTVRRLERDGRLRPIRLTGRKTGQVFFRAEDVYALIASAAAEEV
jgi:hypothetical protein